MVRSIAGLGVASVLFFVSGCVTPGDVLRTPEQWREDVGVQMAPLVPDFRACYEKSKAGWAEHAKAMGGSGTVATKMKPKPRETVIIALEIDSASAGDRAKISVREGYDDKVPREEHTSDGDLANCVRKVAATKLKMPPKSDTNRGWGTWRIVFVPEANDAPAPPAPKS